MKPFSMNCNVYRIWLLVSGSLLFAAIAPSVAVAQFGGGSGGSDKALAAQIRELQAKVDNLEAMLKKNSAGQMSSDMKDGSMSDMKKKDGMDKPMAGKGMMSKKKAMMGDKKGMGMGMSGDKGMGMGMGMGMSGMAMMGKVKGTMNMQVPSALPGFAGASHIYHIGATSFFLDHAAHITLTQEQQVQLNKMKEKVLLDQATFDRSIAQAEQELWVLTSSDKPDAAKIEGKIRDIEKLSGEKRIAYIRAVGESAKVLTDKQRSMLVGALPPEHEEAGK